jgi:hypothetical protein
MGTPWALFLLQREKRAAPWVSLIRAGPVTPIERGFKCSPLIAGPGTETGKWSFLRFDSWPPSHSFETGRSRGAEQEGEQETEEVNMRICAKYARTGYKTSLN